MKTLFNHFGVTKPTEQTSAGKIFAAALKEPMADFEKLPWKEMLKKYDKYSMINWMVEVRMTYGKVASLLWFLYCFLTIVA